MKRFFYLLGIAVLLCSCNDEKSFTVNGVTFSMVKVKGGDYTLLESAENAGGCVRKSYQTKIDDYYIATTEVTQELWLAVMGDNPSYNKGDMQYPVEEVDLVDCHNFINKLNALTGEDFRLPTEAEWEYAARGGNKSKGFKYAGGDKLDEVAWYASNSGGKTHPVATKKPNELGIYDMTGNVSEWLKDWFGLYVKSDDELEYYYQKSKQDMINEGMPNIPGFGEYLGGNYESEAKECSIQYYGLEESQDDHMVRGLRLVLGS